MSAGAPVVGPARPPDFLEWMEHFLERNKNASEPEGLRLTVEEAEKLEALAAAIRNQENTAAVVATVEAAERTVDMLATTGMAAARVLGLDAPDVPRLLVSASCRTLERLVESYARRQDMAGEGKIAWDLAARGRMREEILASATDLRLALEGGLDMVMRIGASLTAKGVTET